MINEFGELIEASEVLKIAQRIMNLAPEKIDLLWYRCGWIDSVKTKGNKALSNKKIREIKKSTRLSKQHSLALFLETPKKEVLSELSDLENV